MNKYFVLSTFYTFYLHINIRKDYTHHAKTTDSIKKFPAPASRSNHLGYRFCGSSVGMKYVGGFTFNAVRSLIGAVVLIPLIFILKKRNSPLDSASKASGRSDTSSNTVSNMQEKKTLIIAVSPAVSASVWQAISNSSASSIQPSEKPALSLPVIL